MFNPKGGEFLTSIVTFELDNFIAVFGVVVRVVFTIGRLCASLRPKAVAKLTLCNH